MKKNSLHYFRIIALLYVISAILNGQAIYDQSKGYVDDKSGYVEVLNFEDRLLNVKEWIFTGSEWDKKSFISKKKLKGAETHYAIAEKYSYYFIAGSIAFIVIVLVVYWGGNNLCRVFRFNSHYDCPGLPDNWHNYPNAGD